MMRILVFAIAAALALPALADAQPRRAMEQQRSSPPAPETQQLQPNEIQDMGTTRCRLGMVRAHNRGVTIQCTNALETDWNTNLHMYFAPTEAESASGPSADLVASIASSAIASDAIVRITYWGLHRYDQTGCGYTVCRRIRSIEYE